MSTAALTTLAQLTLGIAACCCLSLAMERHARQAGEHFQQPRQRTALRWGGWTLLTITLLIAVSAAGWGFGLVTLFGALSAATVVVIALITYRPHWLVPALLVSVTASSALIGFYALF